MDGLEATRQLRAAGVTEPIIALTANAMADQREEFLDAGADALVAKPVEFEGLLATLAAFGVQGNTRVNPSTVIGSAVPHVSM